MDPISKVLSTTKVDSSVQTRHFARSPSPRRQSPSPNRSRSPRRAKIADQDSNTRIGEPEVSVTGLFTEWQDYIKDCKLDEEASLSRYRKTLLCRFFVAWKKSSTKAIELKYIDAIFAVKRRSLLCRLALKAWQKQKIRRRDDHLQADESKKRGHLRAMFARWAIRREEQLHLVSKANTFRPASISRCYFRRWIRVNRLERRDHSQNTRLLYAERFYRKSSLVSAMSRWRRKLHRLDEKIETFNNAQLKYHKRQVFKRMLRIVLRRQDLRSMDMRAQEYEKRRRLHSLFQHWGLFKERISKLNRIEELTRLRHSQRGRRVVLRHWGSVLGRIQKQASLALEHYQNSKRGSMLRKWMGLLGKRACHAGLLQKIQHAKTMRYFFCSFSDYWVGLQSKLTYFAL